MADREQRKKRETKMSLLHSPEFVAAIWILLFALEAWLIHRSATIVLGIVAILLLIRAVRRFRRANEEIAAVEAATAPAWADPRPLESESPRRSPLRLLLLPLLAILLLLEYHPFLEAALRLTSYRMVPAADDCVAPLHRGDQVWVRLGAVPPERGVVVALPCRGPGVDVQLATVVAAAGDTLRETRLVDWAERDDRDLVRFVNGVVAIPPPGFRPVTVRVVPRDSVVITGHVHGSDDAIELEMVPATRVRGIATRILFPPDRWRRLP